MTAKQRISSVIGAGLAGILALSNVGCESQEYVLPNGKTVTLNYHSVVYYGHSPYVYRDGRKILLDNQPDYELHSGAYIEGVVKYIGLVRDAKKAKRLKVIAQGVTDAARDRSKNATMDNNGVVIVMEPVSGAKELVLYVINRDNDQSSRVLLDYIKHGDKIEAPTVRRLEKEILGKEFAELNQIDTYYAHEIRKL